jgi:hypothetical protein
MANDLRRLAMQMKLSLDGTLQLGFGDPLSAMIQRKLFRDLYVIQVAVDARNGTFLPRIIIFTSSLHTGTNDLDTEYTKKRG